MIQISDSAIDKINEMIAAEEIPNLFLRLSVKAGGCSGFSYGMGLDDEQSESDQVMDIKAMKVVVDADSYKYLNGIEIDYENSGMGGGFTIHNPNAVATCGCGQSFKHREEEGNVEKCDDTVEA